MVSGSSVEMRGFLRCKNSHPESEPQIVIGKGRFKRVKSISKIMLQLASSFQVASIGTLASAVRGLFSIEPTSCRVKSVSSDAAVPDELVAHAMSPKVPSEDPPGIIIGF